MADGLMVLRADNSRGKSTAVQSFLFALGLERMITARPAHSLTAAMRDRLIYDQNTKGETPVLSSWVSIELEGQNDTVATITRWVKHDEIGSGLVRVAHGPALSAPGQYEMQDYYVGRAGAAANPRGFHHWLASFIGWELPELPATDGRVSPLYMEQVFPLLFVEQRRGWGGIQAQMPYFSGVSDVRRRSIEFLLDLDVGKLEAERLRLRSRETQLQNGWKATVKAFKDAIRGQGLITIGLPETLTVAWPPQEPPMVAESRDSNWIGLDDLLIELRQEHRRLESAVLPRVRDDESESEDRLTAALEEADALREASALLREEILREQTELHSLQDRLEALREDLRQHQDIITLQRLGSEDLERLHGDCPVCHQQLPTSLLITPTPVRTLSAQDTAAYIKQQIELFEVMERDTRRTLEAKTERWAAIRAQSADLRSQIRALRTTLSTPNGTPSVEAITRQVRLRERIDRYESVRERFYGLMGELERLGQDGRSVRAALGDLPSERLSPRDREKLNLLERSFVDQLRSYDFGSFSDERLRISPVDYLPRREEFDLQADISASDSIRVIWAYLLGLLEISKRLATNHPLLLVLDEPRQQSAKEISFRALLQRAAQDSVDHQIVFATSEDLGSLNRMLDGLPHRLHAIDGYVLKPVVD
ncbi:hypothetical protein Sme01_45020 [Sphaerisporangium melleum]|nr:hypothetical protein Sme01_45020 [Sphaerisporangium melleum]